MTPIRVELELADGTFTTRMMRAGQTIRQFKQEVASTTPALQKMQAPAQDLVRVIGLADRHTKGFLATLRDFAIVTGIVSVAVGKLSNIQSSWVGHIVRVNAEFQRLAFQMRSMSTAADPIREAGQHVNFLRRAALDMPFKISTINNAFVKLKATGTDPLNGSLQALADGVAAFGGTDAALDRVVLGISQMSGKGVIQMEELRQQLGEQMPTAVQVMARSMGVSMGQLIKDISTGMLSAKEALALFFHELERSYGGRARYMMQTFEGQLKRTQTQLQNLALIAGGLNADGSYVTGGFMATLTQQLEDLNQFMTSRAASVIAQDLGRGLAEAVRWVRTAIEWLIEFRSEIIAVAKAVALAFTFRVAIAGLSALGGALKKLQTELTAMGDAWQLFGRRMRYASMEMRSGAPALEVWGMRGAAASQMVNSIGSRILSLIPIIGTLGVVLVEGASYFDQFAKKAEQAWEEVKKFGAESRRAVDEAADARITQLKAQIAAIENIMSMTSKDWNPKLEELREQIAEIERLRPRLRDEAGEREDQRYLDQVMKKVERIRQARQTAYIRDASKIEEEYNKELKAAQEAGRSVEELDKKFGERRLQLSRQLHETRIADLKKSIKEQEDLARRSMDTILVGQANKVLEHLREMHLAEQKELGRVLQQVAGTPIIPTAADDKERFEKGQAHLKRLQAEVLGLKAALTGANAEVVELQAVLENTQKYGHMDTSGVQELIDKLVEAQAQKELLDKLMKGKKRLEDDIEQNRLRLLEREMELREKAIGRELTGAERIKMRMEQGYYDGFGPESETTRWLRNIISHFDAQGKAASDIGNVIRENTFGEQTVTRIKTVNDELREMAGILNGIGQGLNRLNFSKINLPGDSLLPGGEIRMAPSMPMVLSSGARAQMGDLMQMFLNEGVSRKVAAAIIGNFKEESGFNPTIVGDGGASFGLAQWHKSRWTELRNFAAGLGMSEGDPLAQVKFTLHEMATKFPSLMARMENASSVEEASDLFMRIFEKPADWAMVKSGPKRRQAARAAYEMDVAAAPAPALPTAAPDLPVYGANQALVELQETLNRQKQEFLRSLDEQIAKERQLNEQENAHKRVEKLEELKAKAKEASIDVEGLQSNYAELVKEIEQGKWGTSRDINADEYKELIAAAKELDRIEAETAERRKAYRQIQSDEEKFAQRRVELARQAQEAHDRMLDPLEERTTRAYRALERELDEYVRAVERYYQGDKAKVAEAEAFKTSLLRQHRQMEVSEYFASLSRKTQDTKNALLSQSQARTLAMQRELAEIDRWVERARQAGMEEVEIVRQAEEAKAAIRAQYAQQMNPMGRMMQEWSDLQGNLAQASAQWMNSLADGLTNLIMGTGDLRSVIQGILRDLINIGIKYIMSQMMGAKTGGGGKFGGMAMGGKGFGGKGKMFPIAHTGGIIGVSRLARRMAHPGMFIGAPRYHTGGIVGGPRLRPDEVPIIARKGEGVFTPEQMQAMGGFQQNIQINAPVTVNGSAGTPEQNEDLAKRTARQMEATIRGIVADEMRKATRPGNFANQRGGR